MKRKTFILTASAVVAGLPFAYYFKSSKWNKYPVTDVPQLLSSFCSENELKAIGKTYKKLVPKEAEKKVLRQLLLQGISKADGKLPDDKDLLLLIGNKVKEDFEAKRTVVVNGWILSATEARQCALFSLA